MLSLVLQKLGSLAVVLILASILVWGMLLFIPGDPAVVLAGGDLSATPEQIEAVREEFGLNRPVHERYLAWLGNALRGNLGTSTQNGYPVLTLVTNRLPATLQLGLLGMAAAVLVALPLGSIAGMYPNRRLATIIRGYWSLTLAVPSFWAAILFVLIFVESGLTTLPATSRYVPLFSDPVTSLRNLAGPVLVLVLLLSGILTRFLARSVQTVRTSEFVRTALAKGVTGPRLFASHVLRNAALPTITIVGLQLAAVLGGVIVIEVVFNYPGIGLLTLQAINQRDYATVQAVVLFAVLAFVVVNAVVDVLYMIIDPRVRVGASPASDGN